MELRICEDCNKPAKAYIPPSRPMSGEFYCEDCDRSYRVRVPEEADYWLKARG